MTVNQLKNGSQFFRVLKRLTLEKNSLRICFAVGFTKLPCWSIHPYDGGSKMLSNSRIIGYKTTRYTFYWRKKGYLVIHFVKSAKLK